MPSNDQIISTVSKTLAELGVKPGSKILAGVSGGVDSMVLASLLKELGFDLTVSHINFSLRDSESDLDEQFVEDWFARHAIPLLLLKVDTNKYALKKNLNIQSAAREIRYNFWDGQLAEKKYDFIATGHHHDDSIETFFLNAIRGTGVKGLTGIPPKRNGYIRPLIHLSRNDIETFAAINKIKFRTDSSNEKDNYRRNQIRHHLIPVVKEISTESNVLAQTLRRLNIEWDAWKNLSGIWEDNNVRTNDEGFHITASPAEYAFVLRWLEEKGFPWQLSYDYVTSFSRTGIVLVHKDFRLSKAKDGFHVARIINDEPVLIEQPGIYIIGRQAFSINPVPASEYQMSNDPSVEFINKKVVTWPLRIRKVKAGDNFQPLGMSGKTKKLQDYLVDIKLDQHEKLKVNVLESNDQIIWLIGRRLDERAKVKGEETEIFKLTFLPLSGE